MPALTFLRRKGPRPARRSPATTSRSVGIANTAICEEMAKELIACMLSKMPRRRFVKVEQIADVVALCAAQEGAFMNGAALDISGERAT